MIIRLNAIQIFDSYLSLGGCSHFPNDNSFSNNLLINILFQIICYFSHKNIFDFHLILINGKQFKILTHILFDNSLIICLIFSQINYKMSYFSETIIIIKGFF